MTVNETLIICKILAKNGYGDYKLTCEVGQAELMCYPNCISDTYKSINMDGNEWDAMPYIPPCDKVSKAIKRALLRAKSHKIKETEK